MEQRNANTSALLNDVESSATIGTIGIEVAIDREDPEVGSRLGGCNERCISKIHGNVTVNGHKRAHSIRFTIGNFMDVE